MAADSVRWWQKFGTAAQIAQVVFTALGVIAVAFQINTLREGNQATSARQVYLGYLEKEFQFPQFATPDYDAIRKSPPSEQSQYESFVSYLLYACEETLQAFGRMPEWRNTCDEEVRVHLPFLCDKLAAEPNYLRTFSGGTAQFVRDAMLRYGVAAPACRVTKS